MAEKYSYCALHRIYPTDEQPCWACVGYFNEKELFKANSEPAILLAAAAKLAELAIQHMDQSCKDQPTPKSRT